MDPAQGKSFFQRPEGKTGMIVGGLLLVGACLGGWVLLPYLITLLSNLFIAAGLCAAAAFIVYLIADKRVRTLAAYIYKAAMRAITGVIVEIDPIGILRSYVDDLNERLEAMNASISALVGQMTKLKIRIDENEAKRQSSLRLADAAHKAGSESKPAFILQSRQAGRLNKSNVTLKSLYATMESLLARLKKMREVSAFLVADIESEVEVKAAERAAIQASYSAFTNARRVIAGDGDKREMFDMAMESLTQDYAMKLGEIEEFMSASDGFIKGVDLENGIFELEALDELNKWDTRIDQLLDEPGTAKSRVAIPGTRVSENVGAVRVADPIQADPQEDPYADLFNPPNLRK